MSIVSIVSELEITLLANSNVLGQGNVSSSVSGLNLCKTDGLNLIKEIILWSILCKLAHSTQMLQSTINL